MESLQVLLTFDFRLWTLDLDLDLDLDFGLWTWTWTWTWIVTINQIRCI